MKYWKSIGMNSHLVDQIFQSWRCLSADNKTVGIQKIVSFQKRAFRLKTGKRQRRFRDRCIASLKIPIQLLFTDSKLFAYF